MVGLPSIVFRRRWLRPGDLLIAMVIHTNAFSCNLDIRDTRHTIQFNPAPFERLKTSKFNPFILRNREQERVDFRRQD